MVEDLLAARGIVVSHETVRCWRERFGRDFAITIGRRAARFGDKWHLGELVVTINGKPPWLWRAADQDGFVLDALVQTRRRADVLLIGEAVSASTIRNDVMRVAERLEAELGPEQMMFTSTTA